eukprot:gene5865-11842_t
MEAHISEISDSNSQLPAKFVDGNQVMKLAKKITGKNESLMVGKEPASRATTRSQFSPEVEDSEEVLDTKWGNQYVSPTVTSMDQVDVHSYSKTKPMASESPQRFRGYKPSNGESAAATSGENLVDEMGIADVFGGGKDHTEKFNDGNKVLKLAKKITGLNESSHMVGKPPPSKSTTRSQFSTDDNDSEIVLDTKWGNQYVSPTVTSMDQVDVHTYPKTKPMASESPHRSLFLKEDVDVDQDDGNGNGDSLCDVDMSEIYGQNSNYRNESSHKFSVGSSSGLNRLTKLLPGGIANNKYTVGNPAPARVTERSEFESGRRSNEHQQHDGGDDDEENEEILHKGHNISSISPSMNKNDDISLVPPSRRKPQSSSSNISASASIAFKQSKTSLENHFLNKNKSNPNDKRYLEDHLGDELVKDKPLPALRKKGKGQGQMLTPEIAYEIIEKERNTMETEKSILRTENETLRDELKKKSTKNHVKVIEKIVETTITDEVEAARWKEEADKLRKQNDDLLNKQRNYDPRRMLQSVIAHEALGHPLSTKNNENADNIENVQNDFREKLKKDYGLESPPKDKEMSRTFGDSTAHHVQEERESKELMDGNRHSHSHSGHGMKGKGVKEVKGKNVKKVIEEKSESEEDDDDDDDDDDDSEEEDDEDVPEDDEEEDEDDAMMARMNVYSARKPSVPKVPTTVKGKALPTLALPGGARRNDYINNRYVEEKDDHHVPIVSARKSGQTSSSVARVPPVLVGPYKHPALPILLWEGGGLWKIPFNGKGPAERRTVAIKRAGMPGPNARPVRIIAKGEDLVHGAAAVPVAYTAFPPTLTWFNPASAGERKNTRELMLTDGTYTAAGSNTPAFWKYLSRAQGAVPRTTVCFSVVTSTRTLDLAADSDLEAEAWKNAMQCLLGLLSRDGPPEIQEKLTWNHEDTSRLPSARRKAKEEGKLSARPFNEPLSSRGTVGGGVQLTARSAANAEAQRDLQKRQIFHAALTGDKKTFTEILETGLSVNIIDPVSTDTPLMIACRANKPDIVRLCLRFGARNDPHPDFGQTALHAAVSSKSYECALELLTAAQPSGANVLISNLADPRGQTPLHVACSNGDVQMCQLLLHHGSELIRGDNSGQSPLHQCAASGHKACLALLLDHGGDTMLDERDALGNCPLHYSAREGHLDCVRLLLETAADGSARNNAGQTAYNVATSRGHQQISLLLLEYLEPLTSRLTARDNNPYPLSARGSARSHGPPSSRLPPHNGLLTSPGTGTGPEVYRPRPGGYSDPHRMQQQQQQHLTTTMPMLSVRSISQDSSTISVSSSSVLPRPHTNSPNLVRNSSNSVGNSPTSIGSSNSYRVVNSSRDRGRSLDGTNGYISPRTTINNNNNSNGAFLPPIFQGLEVHPQAAQSSEGAMAYGHGQGYGYGITSYSSQSEHDAQNSAFGDYNGYHFQQQDLSEPPSSAVGYEDYNQYQQQGYDYGYQGEQSAYSNSYDYDYDYQNSARAPLTPQRHSSEEKSSSLSPLEVMQRSYKMARGTTIDPRQQSVNYTNSDSGYGYEQYEDIAQTQGQGYDNGTGTEVESYPEYDYANYEAPNEQFPCEGIEWSSYVTEEGHIYYLDSASGHSQWDDPRTHGVSPEYGAQDDNNDSQQQQSQLSDGTVTMDYNDAAGGGGGSWATKSSKGNPPPKGPTSPRSSPSKNNNNNYPLHDDDVISISTDMDESKTSGVTGSGSGSGFLKKDSHYNLLGTVPSAVRPTTASGLPNPMTQKYFSGGPRQNYSESETEDSYDMVLGPSVMDLEKPKLKKKKKKSDQHSKSSSSSMSTHNLIMIKDLESEMDLSGDFFSPKEGGSLEVSADDPKDFHEAVDAAILANKLSQLTANSYGNSNIPIKDRAAGILEKMDKRSKETAEKKLNEDDDDEEEEGGDSGVDGIDEMDMKLDAAKIYAENSYQDEVFDFQSPGEYGCGGNIPPTSTSTAMKISRSEINLKQSSNKSASSLLQSKSVAALHEEEKNKTKFPVVAIERSAKKNKTQSIQAALSAKFARVNSSKGEDLDFDTGNEELLFEKYKGRLVAGESVRSVRDDMEEEDESKELIARVMRLADNMSIEAQQKVAAATAAEKNDNHASTGSKNGADDDAALLKKMDKYMDMLRRGKSLRVVRREMEALGEATELIMRVVRASDELDLNLNRNEAGSPKKRSPRQRKSVVEVEAHESMADLKEDPVLGKYARMASVGVPTSNVLQRMKLDNVSLKDIRRFQRASGVDVDDDVVVVHASEAPHPVPVEKETLDALKEDPVVGKYARMAAVGVPTSNVVQRMQLDGIGPLDIARFIRATGEESTPTSEIPRPNTAGGAGTGDGLKGPRTTGAVGSGGRPATAGGGGGSRPTVSLQKIHWDTLPAEKLRNSVWKTTDEDDGGDGDSYGHGQGHQQDHDMDELQELFGSREMNRSRSNSKQDASKSDTGIRLVVLDAKRAQNVVIGLAQFKSFGPHANLFRAVCAFDKCNDQLDTEKVEKLRALLPTSSEASKLKDQRVQLTHPAEQFFKVALDFYPELPLRLNTFLSCEHFGDECENALQKVNILIDACNQVISSDKLAKILQKMLAVGNLMNEGTHRGQAEGITLDSLMKMVHMKGVDKKTSVLDYVVKKILSKGHERMLNAPEDISLADEAARLSGTDLSKTMTALILTLQTIENEVNRVKSAAATGINTVAITEEITRTYINKLEDFIQISGKHTIEMTRVKALMARKIKDVVEYFGEDVSTCDTTKIFSVLMEFRKALIASKAAAVRRSTNTVRSPG